MDTAKVSLQSGVSSLAIEGREEFVREVLAIWEPWLKASPLPAVLEGLNANPAANVPAAPEAQTGHAALQYENVYEQLDGKLKIIAHVPGAGKADKTRNVAIILAFGYYLGGNDQIPAELIREACMDQACYDSSNFAQSFKSIKDKIAMNAKPGGSYELKLTAPGRKAAKELVESLNQ